MPANRGEGGPNWDPRPDFERHDRPGHTAAAVDYNDPEQIALCLLDDDPNYFVYEHFSDVDLFEEALVAAKNIISRREATRLQHERELQEAKVRANSLHRAEMRKQTRYLGRVTNLRTGVEEIIESQTAVPARSFA